MSAALYTQRPVQDVDGQWYITYDRQRLKFPTKESAETGILLHAQAAAVEKKHDGVSPAAASVGGDGV